MKIGAALPRLIPVAFLLGMMSAVTLAQGWFAYTDPYRVVTLEFKGENLALVNIMNLTDAMNVFLPQDFLVIRSDGSEVCGQVYASRGPGGISRYTAACLVKAHTAEGVDLVGPFRQKGDVRKVLIQQGGRILELQSLQRGQFDALLGRLDTMELTAADPVRAMKAAEIPDLGNYIAFEAAGEILAMFEKLLTPDGVNPPRILRQTPVLLTPEAEAAGLGGKVILTVQLDAQGGVREIHCEPAAPASMQTRITETLRNGWVFLPATRSGETVATEIKITLDFGERRGTGKIQETK